MARSTADLIRNLDPRHDRHGWPMRILAAVTVLALVLGSLAPGWALAAEGESEGEEQGTAPPGLGNPSVEPGGPETVLEALPGSTGEEPEEGAEPAPVEAEPAQEPVVPEAAEEPMVPEDLQEPVVPEAAPGVAEPPAVPEPAPPATGPPTAVPAAPPPEYAPAPASSPPAYETAPPPTAQPVENEALVDPSGSPEAARGHVERKARGHAPASGPPTEVPAVPTQPTPTPAPPPTAVLPGEGAPGPGRVAADRSSYTVRPGDCLWSIAAAMLAPGAGDVWITAEVARLWRLNAERIGTGDPDLIFVGTVLRMR